MLGSLIIILLIAGCSNLPFEIPFLSSSGPQVKELPPDVISINNITVLPSTSVRARDPFSVYFEVLNQEDTNEVPVSYNLYDTGLCTFKGGEPNVSNVGDYYSYGNFSPQETKLIEWTFQAPSADYIAHLSVTCPIRFKFNYTYTASSQIDVLVADSNYLSELQRAGKATEFSSTINVGRGPIKIYFDFGTSLPVKNNSYLPVYVKVEDKGTGILKQIDSGTFKIQFPKDFIVEDGDDNCPYFHCDSSTRLCESNSDIIMVDRKSLEIRCSGIKTPNDISPAPEKTYFINASIDYAYYAAGEVDIEVKPE